MQQSADYGPSTYGERIAAVYDEWVGARVAEATDAAVALLAGLELEERFGGWRTEPFTASSPSHISVYRRG